MKNENTDTAEIFAFPSEEEIKAAQLACCGRNCSACESPAEYAWRKRSVDLAVLLESAIEKELSETEKGIITAFWFEDKSISVIADERSISPAAVHSNLERAQLKLKNVLEYTVRYQNDILPHSPLIPLALAKARVIAAARMCNGKTVGERIRDLRVSENYPRSSLVKVLGISEIRLKNIEKSVVSPDVSETVAFSEFFGVTTDYILKGA